MTAEEGNKLIAEFLGYKYHLHPDVFALPGWKIPTDKMIPAKLLYDGGIGKRPYLARTTKQLKFHSSWDWLMPVVEKIDTSGFDTAILKDEDGSQCMIFKAGRSYHREEKDLIVANRLDQRETKIESVWLSIVEFIEWVNSNKTK